MSPEQEPQQYNFPWQYDTEHYLGVKTEYGDIQMRPSTTMLYLFPDQPEVDHIYVVMEELDDETTKGMRLFREHVDRLGEGAFGALVDQLVEHGFSIADDEEPSELDIQAWEQAFDKTYDPVKKLVQLAMKNFDSAWAYYEPEWSNRGEDSL